MMETPAPYPPSSLWSLKKLIWGALAASTLLYVAVVRLAAGGPAAPPYLIAFDLDQPLEVFFIVLAIFTFVLGFALPPHLARWGHPLEPAAAQKRELAAYLIRLALFEAIALYGLVISLVQRDANKMIPYSALALLGLLFSLPGRDRRR